MSPFSILSWHWWTRIFIIDFRHYITFYCIFILFRDWFCVNFLNIWFLTVFCFIWLSKNVVARFFLFIFKWIRLIIFIILIFFSIKRFDRAERHDLNHDFGYSFPLLLFPKKRGKKKRRMKSKNRDFNSCISAWSKDLTNLIHWLSIYSWV